MIFKALFNPGRSRIHCMYMCMRGGKAGKREGEHWKEKRGKWKRECEGKGQRWEDIGGNMRGNGKNMKVRGKVGRILWEI